MIKSDLIFAVSGTFLINVKDRMNQIYPLISLLISIIITILSLPRILIVAKNRRLFDEPNERSAHTAYIPRLGGLAFFPALVISLSLTFALKELIDPNFSLLSSRPTSLEVLMLLPALFLIYGMGVLDDLRSVSFRKKFFGQIFCAVLIITSGVYIRNLHGLLGLNELSIIWSYLISLFFIVLVINAINLIDGIDGLAAGLSCIALLFFGFWFLFFGLFFYSCMSFALFGTVIIFFLFNVYGTKMKLFMGDTGSMILGTVLAFLGIKFCNVNDAQGYLIDCAPIIVFSVLFIPLFDVLRVFIVRIKEKKSPFLPDRNHIHHRLLAYGLSQRKAMVLLLVSSVFYIVFNWILISYIDCNILLGIDIGLAVFLVSFLNRRIRMLDSAY